ncbi:MAG: hypothetical protein WCR01_13280 [Bacteroidota bacterium]
MKSENRQQIYGKNAVLQPGWVNIQVPPEVAESLSEIIQNSKVHLPDLAMFLSKDVFDALTTLFDNTPGVKNSFIDLLFKFLDMDSSTENNYYDQDTHLLFHDIYRILSACTEYLENRKMEGGHDE